MFSLIVAADMMYGIAQRGKIPWRIAEEMSHFRRKTIKNGTVVMGRKTWETLPKSFAPLPERKNVVISRTRTNVGHPDVEVVDSLDAALTKFPKSMVIGGEGVYQEAISRHFDNIDQVHLSIIEKDYRCDQFLSPYLLGNFTATEHERRTMVDRNDDKEVGVNLLTLTKSGDSLHFPWWKQLHPSLVNGEMQYLFNLNELLSQPLRKTRNSWTRAIFNRTMNFDLSISGSNFPLLTTKKMFLRGITEELGMFLRGDTDARELTDKKIRIWDKNTTAEFLEHRGLPYREGDMGPMYGFQWRHFGAEYEGCDYDYTGLGYDQLRAVIEGIKKDPNDRRLLMTTYHPGEVSRSVLAPCHSIVIQFFCEDDWLDCVMYQRSADIVLGVPFNIASTSTLLHLVAHVTGRKARKMSIHFGDLHLYESHEAAAKEQLSRTVLPGPNMFLKREYDPETDPIEYLEGFSFKDLGIDGYQHHPPIKVDMIA